MGSTAAHRPEVAISSTEYDLAVAKDLAERLLGRLSSGGKSAIHIGVTTADATAARTKDDSNAWTKSRLVVILFDRLWGRTPATAAVPEAIAARKKASPKSIKVIRLDDTPVPASLRGTDAKQIGQGLESIVEWLTTSLAAAGGPVKKAKVPVKSKAPVPTPLFVDSRRSEVSETFLGSSRAVAVCAREFERLADTIAKRATSAAEKAGAKAEVQRMPDRCLVQMGPVAVSVSWVRERVDTAATGRLMIAEWQGTVVRTPRPADVAPAAPVVFKPATLVRENILFADATGEPDWIWRREPVADLGYATRDLAAQVVDSLVLSLQETAQA